MTEFDAVAPAEPAAVGAPELVASIYDQHQRELFTFALRACRDRDTAQDLIHETFVRLIVEIEAGRTPDHVRGWLYRVTANLAATHGRRATAARRWLAGASPADDVRGPEPIFLDHERQSDLASALGELPTDARTALLMAANGFSGHEIAAAIGRTGSATRTLMCRARLNIRKRLGSMASWA